MSGKKPDKSPGKPPGGGTQGSSSRPSGTASTSGSSYTTWTFTQPARQQQGSGSTGGDAPPNQALVTNRTIAENTLNDFGDTELQAVLNRRYHHRRVTASGPRPSMDEVRNRIANVLGVLGRRGLSARDVVIRLAEAGWDHTTVITQYAASRFPQMQQEVQNTQGITDDGDDDQPIPDDVKPIQILIEDEPGKPRRRVNAVFHYEIRRYLIERDRRRYGDYPHGRDKGEDPEDQTAPHPKQLRWSFKQGERKHWPAILFRYQQAGYEGSTAPFGMMWWRGHVVVDIDRRPLMDLPTIPSTLAANPEGGLLEAIVRLDRRVRHSDLSARLWDPKTSKLPNSKEVNRRDNKVRFREANGVITWNNSRSGGNTHRDWVDDNLPLHLEAQNITYGFGPFSAAEQRKIKAAGVGSAPNRSRHKDPAKREKYVAANQKQLKEDQRKAVFQKPKPKAQDTETEIHQSALDLARPISDFFGPDAREAVPQNAEEEAALHDAMLPTILQFLNVTGDLPVISNWQLSYQTILANIDEQLRRYSRTRNVPYAELVGYGFWTGGILNIHSADLEAAPLATKEAEAQKKREEEQRWKAMTQPGEMQQDEEEDGEGEEEEGGAAEHDDISKEIFEESEESSDEEDEAAHSARSDV
ncbi:MAG: hypothetical protein Q9169_003418 [Polycauliona sp. 2 TL-2023]